MSHDELFFRFAEYSISGEMLSWLKQFLVIKLE